MTETPDYPHDLSRTVLIRATTETVFRFFTDPELFARWWGEGSTIEGRVGGAMRICYPNGATASGEVLAIDPSRSVVFTFGYDDPDKPIAPGGSRVTVTLEPDAAGTRLTLRHELADASVRDMHVPGWRYQLAAFAIAAAATQHAQVEEIVDRYFLAWREIEDPARRELLENCVVDDVTFRDGYGCIIGIDELNQQIMAAQHHLPGSAMTREGSVRQCQGTAICDWIAKSLAGAEVARGVNVFELAADGRIAGVVGFAPSGGR